MQLPVRIEKKTYAGNGHAKGLYPLCDIKIDFLQKVKEAVLEIYKQLIGMNDESLNCKSRPQYGRCMFVFLLAEDVK